MISGINLVWDVGRGGGTTMNGRGGDIHRSTQIADTLYGMRHGTHSRIDDGALTAHVWYRAGCPLEPVTVQPGRTHPTGLRRQFPICYTPAPLTLSKVPMIVSDMERPQE